jgi:hypothetical protein
MNSAHFSVKRLSIVCWADGAGFGFLSSDIVGDKIR